MRVREPIARPSDIVMSRLLNSVASAALLAASLISLLILNAEASTECDALNAVILGHWPFDGTWDDISTSQRGQAIGAWDREPVGGNVKLQWGGDDSCAGYVHVGNPGYLQVPRVDFYNITFTFSFSVKLNGAISLRRILYADWNTNNWQFMSFLTTDRKITVWFRNGAQSTFVALTSTGQVPLGQWTDIAVVWDRSSRTASIFINRSGSGSQVVAASVTDINLFKSNTYYYQFGAKADSTSISTDYAPLDADVRNLRVLKGFFLAAPEHPSLAMSH
eukprot:TRINITY_DN1699_c0_g1_i1.p1 TRINITY_DN1699_c0_g1~~TRINITY_DN1699_c0_g1_i1.p1  ORF type:complete len:277 (-),score=14.08 TRINITY_DN1699_c0_g1_i1:294-1124(-)